ncbi:Cof-type HAD-IIB family hydrolase [Clostridium polynesiense]|uniref:Cof-type HAD-IIB family hydrolase n=1 Tax=Clostridium polynesiense TaxID=1325933 RepID=UPI00058C8E01|nr:Cof-type HAD-IIB family hydrolase [Clostridium polynesiense]
MIKLIACDMDGTLLNEKGELGRDFFEVFKKIDDLDIKFAVASGRQYHMLFQNFEHIADNLIYIAENGTMVKYKDKEMFSSVIKEEYVEEIIKESREVKDINLILCGKNCAYIDNDDNKILEEAKKYYHHLEIVDDFSKVTDDIIKIAVMDFNGAQKNSYVFFNTKWRDRLQIKVSGEIWVDIFNKDANKGKAMRMIQKKFNIGKKETMVFGDYFNDLEMFEEAYYSYAMENAPEEVKKHARFLAGKNSDNGVIEIIKEKILSKNLSEGN